MILASLATFWKIRRGSQSTFAYVLMTFTLLCGIQDTCRFFIESIRRVVVVNGEVYYLESVQGIILDNGFYMWTAIQTYIFAMKYLESSIQMSVRKPCCTFKCINVMLWVVIVVFTMIVIAVASYQLVKFPGQVNNGSFQELVEFLAGPFTESNGFVTWPWLSLHFCSSCVQCYAIWKIYETTQKLNACKINMGTIMIHLLCIIT